tara:strand:+ start:413 stop:1198 length:786 start_codon:yes stop_codon:yes gene_type:complete
MAVKFSPANAKIKELAKVRRLKKWLKLKRKIFSIDLLSGWSCPGARDCLSKVVIVKGKKHVKDGPDTEFRCFSASQEVLFKHVYNLRKANYDAFKKQASTMGRLELAKWIESRLPPNVGILRIHVGGDFFSQVYFDAWALVATMNPTILFYAYTKSLPYWICRLGQLPDNLVLTASRGGRHDDLIIPNNLREAIVVFSKAEARKRKLIIDHDDSHAAIPQIRDKNFALLIHGTQPKGSLAARALAKLKGVGSYNRQKGVTL